MIAHAVTPLPEGGCLIVGEYEGAIDELGLTQTTSREEAFVLRIDGDGDIAWAKHLLAEDAEKYVSARHVVVHEMYGVFVAGAAPGNASFVAQLDDDGEPIWHAELLAATTQINHMKVHEAGVWVGGVCRAALTYFDPIETEGLPVFTCGANNATQLDGFVLAFGPAVPGSIVETFRFHDGVDNNGGTVVRGFDVRNDKLAVVGHFPNTTLLVDTATVLNPNNGNVTRGFVTVIDVDTSGVPPAAILPAGAGEVKATAVAIVDDSTLHVGGTFTDDVTLANAMLTRGGGGSPQAFASEYGYTASAVTALNNRYVHLGAGEDARVFVHALLFEPATGDTLIVGKGEGAFFPGLSPPMLQPFVLRATGMLPAGVEVLLHVDARAAPVSVVDEAAGFGVASGDDGRVFTAGGISSSWQVSPDQTLEVAGPEPRAFVATLDP